MIGWGNILDGRVGRKELGGEVSVSDGGVRAREGVARVTEWARPDAGGVVDARVGIQYGGAFGADERVVGDYWDIGGLHEGCVEEAKWN